MYPQLKVGTEASYGVASSRHPVEPRKAGPSGFLHALAPYLMRKAVTSFQVSQAIRLQRRFLRILVGGSQLSRQSDHVSHLPGAVLFAPVASV